jgi:hypothetical protein
VTGLSTPQQVQERLEQIDRDLAERQNSLEAAALEWFRAKREREREYAQAYIEATGTVDERKSRAIQASYLTGLEAEARYEALKAVVRVLDTRGAIGMSLLRAQTRGGGL